MIQIENISKSFGGRTLFSDVSFSIGKKDRLVISGRNGSGKTTLLKILSGLEESDGGEIHMPKGHRIGALPQHHHFTKPTLLEEALLGLPEELRDQEYLVERILGGLGFSEEDFSASPLSFSGGFQLRLSLCKVLAADPDLLLLDEPTNYLDILAIRWLESFLVSWHGQIIFISHDKAFVNRISTHVIGIKRGKLKKIKGDLDNYRKQIVLEEELYEKSREKIDKKKAHMTSFIEKYGAKATKAKQAKSKAKAIEKMDQMDALADEENLDFNFRYKEIQNKLLLNVENLDFSYTPEKKLINDLAFELERKERLAIIGKNGSGKSTLLRLLLGDLKPLQGRVAIGQNTSLAYFGQTNIDRLNNDHTVEEELINAFPLTPYSQVRSVLGAMLFSGDDALKRINVLSGGERSRVLLAKILLTPSNLLLLDEPTHHLDIESVEALMRAIECFQGSVIIITHDETVLKALNADKLIICHKARQELFLGTYNEFLDKKGWEEEGGRQPKKDKKDKKKKAEDLQAKSKVIKPLLKKIQNLEKIINQKEILKKELEQFLIENQEDVEPSLKKYHILSEELELLYKDLEIFHDEHEALMSSFDVR
ncbi:ATP-binding cassette domain-containing protein [Chlamydiales bacterium]|nr:ATP-binding cassette domain-containing protein [Chlamydiales bacterium]